MARTRARFKEYRRGNISKFNGTLSQKRTAAKLMDGWSQDEVNTAAAAAVKTQPVILRLHPLG
jgi:hypothetical protein